MRKADRGVDHESPWIDQRSQQHSLEACQEGERNKTTVKREEGWKVSERQRGMSKGRGGG